MYQRKWVLVKLNNFTLHYPAACRKNIPNQIASKRSLRSRILESLAKISNILAQIWFRTRIAVNLWKSTPRQFFFKSSYCRAAYLKHSPKMLLKILSLLSPFREAFPKAFQETFLKAIPEAFPEVFPKHSRSISQNIPRSIPWWIVQGVSRGISQDITFFFSMIALHIWDTNKILTIKINKNNTKSGREQNSFLLLLVNKKVESNILSHMNFNKKRYVINILVYNRKYECHQLK